MARPSRDLIAEGFSSQADFAMIIGWEGLILADALNNPLAAIHPQLLAELSSVFLKLS